MLCCSIFLYLSLLIRKCNIILLYNFQDNSFFLIIFFGQFNILGVQSIPLPKYGKIFYNITFPFLLSTFHILVKNSPPEDKLQTLKKVEFSNKPVIVNVPILKRTTTCLNQRTAFYDLVFAHYKSIYIQSSICHVLVYFSIKTQKQPITRSCTILQLQKNLQLCYNAILNV